MMSERDAMGRALGLIVHDLRNPTSTVRANVDYLLTGGLRADDAEEALGDMQAALEELKQGLEHVAWVSQWLLGQPCVSASHGDVVSAVERIVQGFPDCDVTLETELSAASAHGALGAAEVLRILLGNVQQHVRPAKALVRVEALADEVHVSIVDPGTPIPPALRETAFTLAGQSQLKTSGDGRYSRFVGLFAAALAAQGIGGVLEADEEDGQNVFRLRMRAHR